MTKLYTLIVFSLFYLAACKSATKAFDHGDYANAIERAVKKLQKDPHDAEMKSVLQQAYKYAANQHQEQIRILSNSAADNRWEQIYQQYSQLQRLYDNIQQSPAAVQAAKPVNYAEFVKTYRDKTVDAYYEKGMAFLNKKDDGRTNYRQAYYEFRKALGYRQDDVEIKDKLNEAKELATINVLIAPMDRYGGFMYSNNYQIKNFQNDLVRNIRYNINNEFVNFFTEWDNRNVTTRPDEILDLRLGNFNIGRPYDENKTRQVSKEVVVKETVYSKDSVVKEYAKVHAKITTTRRTLVSNADLQLNISDPENRIIWNDILRSEHRWTTEFATYTGDERALSESDKALLNRQDRNPPREEEVVEELLKKLQNDVTYRLRNYYSRY
jgi:hypothetical protein